MQRTHGRVADPRERSRSRRRARETSPRRTHGMDNRLVRLANITLCIEEDEPICISSNGTSSPFASGGTSYSTRIPHPDDETFLSNLTRVFKYLARYTEAERNGFTHIHFVDDQNTFLLWYTTRNGQLDIIELPIRGLGDQEKIALVRRALRSGEWVLGRVSIRNAVAAVHVWLAGIGERSNYPETLDPWLHSRNFTELDLVAHRHA